MAARRQIDSSSLFSFRFNFENKLLENFEAWFRRQPSAGFPTQAERDIPE